MVRTGYKAWFDDLCVLAHLAKQRAYRVWSRSRAQADFEKYKRARRHSQRVYLEAEREFNERSKVLLKYAPNPRKWWPTVKAAAFGVSSNLPHVVDREERLVWSAEENALLFSARFDDKQCSNSFQQPCSCDRCSMLRFVALRSRFVRRLPLDLDPYGGNDPNGMFPLAPKLAVIFWHRVRGGSLWNVGG